MTSLVFAYVGSSSSSKSLHFVDLVSYALCLAMAAFCWRAISTAGSTGTQLDGTLPCTTSYTETNGSQEPSSRQPPL